MATFQTNPCGVEALCYQSHHSDVSSFRRTLVGLKRSVSVLLVLVLLWFQTNPCGVEASRTRSASGNDNVSDEPLWG